jgi:hypothetical protein
MFVDAAPSPPAAAPPTPPAPSSARRVPDLPTPALQGLKTAHLVARVNRYYSRLGVAGLDVVDAFHVGDVVRVWNAGTDFVQKVTSIQHDRQSVDEAEPGWQIGLRVSAPVDAGDEVYVIRPLERQRALGLDARRGETLIGEVQHFYARIGVATVVLTGQLSLADRIRFRGRTSSFVDTVSSMQRDRMVVKRSPAGSIVGLRVAQRVHPHDLVYRLRKSSARRD